MVCLDIQFEIGTESELCTGSKRGIKFYVPAQRFKESTVQGMAVTLELESVGLVC